MLIALLLAALLAKPDVLIIVLDDVGWTDFQAVDTPNLDELADEGVLFHRAYAHPWCRPTRAALLFSVWDGASYGNLCKLPTAFALPEIDSLPSILSGYSTGLFGKWHLGNNNNIAFTAWETPQLHGFDTWRAGTPDNIFSQACNSLDYTDWKRVDDGVVTPGVSTYNTIAVRDAWCDWWTNTPGEKMAVVAYQAAHEPFHIPPSSILPSSYTPPAQVGPREQYEAMVQSLDFVLGEMLEVVDNDTWVFVFGDNGTPYNALASPSQDPLKVKHTTFEQGVHVPLVVRGPGAIPGDYFGPVNVADIMPTVSGLTMSLMPADRDGISFYGALIGMDSPRDWTYVHTKRGNPKGGLPGSDEAVIEERWKLREFDGTQTLYDLLYDPLEETPLDPDDPVYAVHVTRLRALLAQARS